MKTKILSVVALAFLGGCATVVDKDAIPAAEAQEGLAMAQCRAAVGSHQITSIGQFVECELAAEQKTAIAIKLKDMSIFEAYAGRMRLTAQQADARRITPEEMTAQFAQAKNDLKNQVVNAYNNDMENRARMAAAMSAMGESMQREADRQAYIAAHNQSFNCTTTQNGAFTNTHCN